MNVDHPQELTHLSLCTGYGGIDIGLSRALSGAVRLIAYVEIEAFAVSNLVSKIENGHLDPAPIYTDLKTFPWRRFHGRVDILSGGFPCQPFSSAGARRGDDDPRHLFPYILNGLRELGRPSLVFLENVEGIISSKLKGDGWADPEGTPVLLHVLRELERLGYKTTASVFSASEVGAPHQRKRVFILAVSNELTERGRNVVTESIERSEVGNSNSDGFVLNREERRESSKESDRCEKGSKSTRYTERSSESDSSYNLSAIERYCSRDYRTAYPSFRGQEQHGYEAPRTIIREKDELPNSDGERTQSKIEGKYSSKQMSERSNERETESAMGRTDDGLACGLGTSEQFRNYDNRTDELRMLGNGVVPDTASRAFRILWKELGYTEDSDGTNGGVESRD